MTRPLTLGHYCGLAAVGITFFVLLASFLNESKTLAMDIIIESDLDGLFLFVGAVIGVTSRGQPFKHRYAQMSLLAGLGMAMIDFFLTGMNDALKSSEALIWVGRTVALGFYGLMVLLVCGTYLAFSLPDQD
ncbi:hypothetical protein [Halomonas sp. OfavH-34-E]|uniref:hypothetical protein n=1 Tax=Halomonas sp. OfavH-34-E TaxID=2954491 RepID=UPI002098251C|nr:hypothetical protein [Halomonas sp. OfavH-34-E]MCO7214131.1 hypothetical protein [Halomonas sp. OfavH-34-E]